jgi:hypothetical protein
MPTIQNGDVATSTAVRPLGRLFGPHNRAVAETEEQDAEHGQRRPLAALGHALAAQLEGGNQQAAAMKRGGMVSRAMRIPRYVVPQIRQTAIQARYGRELCGVCGSAMVRVV